MDTLDGYFINMHSLFNWEKAYVVEEERFDFLSKNFKKGVFGSNFPINEMTKRILIALLIYRFYYPEKPINEDNVQDIINDNNKFGRFIFDDMGVKYIMTEYEKELVEDYIKLIDSLPFEDYIKLRDYYLIKISALREYEKLRRDNSISSLSDKVIGAYSPLLKEDYSFDDYLL